MNTTSPKKRRASPCDADRLPDTVPSVVRERWEREWRELKARHARECEELAEKQAAEMAGQVLAATDAFCAACRTPMTATASRSQCTLCELPICDACLGESAAGCDSCERLFCSTCTEDLSACRSCRRSDVFRCCNLTLLPCGEYECGECADDHNGDCERCVVNSEIVLGEPEAA